MAISSVYATAISSLKGGMSHPFRSFRWREDQVSTLTHLKRSGEAPPPGLRAPGTILDVSTRKPAKKLSRNPSNRERRFWIFMEQWATQAYLAPGTYLCGDYPDSIIDAVRDKALQNSNAGQTTDVAEELLRQLEEEKLRQEAKRLQSHRRLEVHGYVC